MPLSDSTRLADFLCLLASWPSPSCERGDQSLDLRPTVFSLDELSSRFRPRNHSSLGLHWDNIDVSASAQVSCACCDALQRTADEYRQTVSLLYRRWLLAASQHRAHWQRLGFTPQQITVLAGLLYEAMVPTNGFFNTTIAKASDEELAAFVCRFSDMSHALRVSPDVPSSYDWQGVFAPAMRTVCRGLLQPFHVAAAKASMRVTRLPMQLMQRDQDDRKATYPETHFVGAVASSGLVVGFTYPVVAEEQSSGSMLHGSDTIGH